MGVVVATAAYGAGMEVEWLVVVDLLMVVVVVMVVVAVMTAVKSR